MTLEGPAPSSSASDDELVRLVRDGDARAYGILWQRHAGPALSVARSFEGQDAEDIVAEAFERLLPVLRRGGGPRAGFRPYLITTVRNVGRRRFNREAPRTDADFELMVDERIVDGEATAVRALDGDAAGAAFSTLPARWQEALWYSEVDGLKPREMSGPLGLAPNAVSALVKRAKLAFRDAWISAQLARATSPECRAVIGELGAYTRGGLSARARSKVDAHLATCPTCPAALDEAQKIARTLALVLLPAVAGTAGAAGYLSSMRPPSMPEMQLPVTTAAAGPDGIEAVGTAGPGAPRDSRLRRLLVLLVGLLLFVVAAASVLPLVFSTSDAGPAPSTLNGTEAGPRADPTAAPSPPAPVSPTRSPSPTDDEDDDRDGSSRPGATAPADPDRTVAPSSSPDPDQAVEPSSPPVAGDTAPPATPTSQLVQSSPRMYPRVTGSAVPGARIEILGSDGTVLATSTAGGDGIWAARVVTGAPGDYEVAARQITRGGTSSAGPFMPYTVDAPPKPVAPTGGAVPADRFNFQMAEAPGTIVQRDIPGQTPVQTLTMPASGSWNEYLAVMPGPHTLRLRFADPGTGDFGPWSETDFTAQ